MQDEMFSADYQEVLHEYCMDYSHKYDQCINIQYLSLFDFNFYFSRGVWSPVRTVFNSPHVGSATNVAPLS